MGKNTMKKANDTYKQPKSLLVLGPPGVGKSTLVAQFPGVFILDTDNNLAGPIDYLKSQGREPDFFYGSPFTDAEDKPLPRGEWFQRGINLLMEAAESSEVSTLAIDSLTGFTEMVLCEVLKQQGRSMGDLELTRTAAKIGDDQMQIQDWGIFFNTMKQLIFRLKNCSKNLIITGHVKTLTDNLTQTLHQAVAIPGQSSDLLPGWFSEVWLLDSDIKRTNTGVQEIRRIITFPQSQIAKSLGLKSSVGIESGTEIDAESIIERLNFSCG